MFQLSPRLQGLANMMGSKHREDAMTRDMLRHGSLPMMIRVLAAIILNHIRRMLAPWLGQYIWWHAIDNMKFARSSPHYFLEASLGFTWREVAVWAYWTAVLHCCRVHVHNGLVSKEKTYGVSAKGLPAKDRGRRRVTLGIYNMLNMAMKMALRENYYTQTCFCAAYLYAFFRLVVHGDTAERAFLAKCLRQNWLHAVFQWCLVLHWMQSLFLPTALEVFRRAKAGSLMLGIINGVIWYGTWYLVRYSNKYFILLELSDMLVTFGWMGVGLLGVVMLLKKDANSKRRGDTAPSIHSLFL
jgi:hypothetical protein